MTQGFKATLFAGVITFGVVASASAAAPVINGIPDITIGDVEGAENEFVFEAPLDLNDYVEYDGDKSELLWSFGESDDDGLATNQYTINGVGAAVSGLDAIADEILDGFPNTLNPAQPIPVGPVTTFRDIVLSPEGGPNQAPSDADEAARGKLITYYVSNGEDVAYANAIIRSVDGGDDSMTPSASWDPVVSDTDFEDWVPSGQSSTGVSIERNSDGLNISVTPTSGLGRVYGWANNSLISYDDVGADKYVRGKFYISTSNPWSAPVNAVPGFRLRVSNEDAVGAAAHFEYPQTALASPPHEPRYASAEAPDAEDRAGRYFRPSGDSSTPSLYRVDFDPLDVPAAAGSNIGALFESYAYSDNANGVLTLHEVVLGTYDALDDSEGTLVFEYDTRTGLSGGIGGAKTLSGGQFNAEANFESGRRQRLYVPGEPQDATEGPWAIIDDWSGPSGAGLIATTRGTRVDRFAMGLLNVQATANADRLRVTPGKLYKANFHAQGILPVTSENPGEVLQGNMRFRFQTAGNTLSYLYELLSPAGLDLSGKVKDIAVEAIPSRQSANPNFDSTYAVDPVLGAKGGWYTLLVPSPLDADGIRVDNGNFGVFGDEPGTGSNDNSLRDVTVGLDLIQAPTHLVIDGGTYLHFSNPNHSEVGVQAIHIYEYPSIDDGGYEYGF